MSAYTFSAGSDISNPANYTPNGTPVAGDTVACSRSVTTGTAAGTWTVSGAASLSGCTFNGPVAVGGPATIGAGTVFNAGVTITNGSLPPKEFAGTVPDGQTLTFTGDGMANGLKLVAGANVAGNISTTAGIRWAAGTFTGKLIQPGGNLWAADAITFPDADEVDGGVQYGPDGTEYEGTGVNEATLTAALAPIKAKTDTINSGSVTITSPYDSATDTLTIVRGDAYLAADSRAISISIDTSGVLPNDISTATAKLKVFRNSAVTEYTATITTAVGATKTFSIPLTKAQTDVLAVGQLYTYEIEVLIGGVSTDPVTLLAGSELNVVGDLR